MRAHSSFLASASLALALGCGEAASEPPESLVVQAPGADAAVDAECQRVTTETGDAGTCVITWSCHEAGALMFACFDTEAGAGCGCAVNEVFGDASTPDITACGSESALAAQARKTCGWSVP